jgi:hypothetical protein
MLSVCTIIAELVIPNPSLTSHGSRAQLYKLVSLSHKLCMTAPLPRRHRSVLGIASLLQREGAASIRWRTLGREEPIDDLYMGVFLTGSAADLICSTRLTL